MFSIGAGDSMSKKKNERELSKGEKSPALFAQPRPKSDKPNVWPLVIKDMADRDHLGKVKYGIPLRSHNGRDALVDAYQEVLDLSVYLRQEIEEKRALNEAVVVARKISGYENSSGHDLAGLLAFLIDHTEKQRSQIQVLSATLAHYQAQSSFVAGFDQGVETAIKIFENLEGETIEQDKLGQILDEADRIRSSNVAS